MGIGLTVNVNGSPQPNSQATLCANWDLPQPGSPVSNNGMPNSRATLTAATNLAALHKNGDG
ncbi:MAG: hypothetical protein H6940_03175 [Burkholderiales bacterium]|nr:hypothetical protein [Burkholderiales bacterium]